MIKRTIITTIIFLLGYVLIIHFHNNGKNSAQYSEQQNIIDAEHYLFDNTDTIKAVIVGSSLVQRINTDSANGLYNLGFGGYGAQDGLRIILMKKKLPPVVFVETNFSFNKVRMDFQQHFDKSFEYPEKQYIPIMMSQNQPVSLVLGIIRNRPKPKKVYDTSMNNTEHTALFSTMMVHHKELFNHADTAAMNKSFVQLRMYIDAVEKEDQKCIFYRCR